MKTIKVANIIEEGRLGGPQVRIAEVAGRLNSRSRKYGAGGRQRDEKVKIEDGKHGENNVVVDTTVVFPFEDGEAFKKRLENYGIAYIQLHLHHLSKEKKQLLKYILFFPYEVYLLYNVLKKQKFDIVHISGGSWQYKGVIAGKIAGCRVVWHLNDTKMPDFIRAFFKFFADRFADGFIVAGERVRKYYIEDLKIGKNKPVFEIQAPVDCSVFNPASIDPEPKISSCDGINIVTVGNINPLKGFEYFLQMAKELNKKYSMLNFWIVGPCFESQKKYFARLTEAKQESGLDNCFFYGGCDDIRRVLKAADIYVCTSISEASPLSVWEAMSMGKPVVSTDVGDVARFVRDGYNGFIVPVAEYKALADKTARLVNDVNLRRTFGKRARETAAGYLDLEIIAEGHLKAYSHMMKKRARVV